MRQWTKSIHSYRYLGLHSFLARLACCGEVTEVHTHDLIKPLCLAGSRMWQAQSARHRLRFQTCSRPDSQTSKSVRKKGEKDKKEKGGGKWQWLRRRTQPRDLANGLPCSDQLSYQVTRQLSGWVRVLKAELPGIQPKRIPSWHVRCGECEKKVYHYFRAHCPRWTHMAVKHQVLYHTY